MNELTQHVNNLVYANLELSRDRSFFFVGGERRVIEFELELLFVFCRLASILSGVCHSSLVFLFTARASLLRILLPQTDRSALLNCLSLFHRTLIYCFL